jgi:hypothetical protein
MMKKMILPIMKNLEILSNLSVDGHALLPYDRRNTGKEVIL